MCNEEAESIRSRAESTGGCVKLQTVTQLRWSSARDILIFIAESVYFVLNSLWDWEPVKRFRQRIDVVSCMFFLFFYFWYKASSIVLNVTKAIDGGIRQTRKEGIAVDEA